MAKNKCEKEVSEPEMPVEEKVTENEPPPEKIYDLSKVNDQVAMFEDGLETDEIKTKIVQYLKSLIKEYKVDNYNIILLFDSQNSISAFHADNIYRAVVPYKRKKDILMIIESDGGRIEPAYLISKTCKRLSKNKFSVSIPRKAKSAATLISLGADELHMGLLSELGPIDPQFNGFPALGLANAVEKIAEMTAKYPAASDMFAQYLTKNVSVQHLGYFERINESAMQYAIRLLDGKKFPDSKTSEDLADHFTNHYKDHSFLIDSDEAAGLLGATIVKTETKEYFLGNAIYQFLDFIAFLFGLFKEKEIRYVGAIENGLELTDKKKSNN